MIGKRGKKRVRVKVTNASDGEQLEGVVSRLTTEYNSAFFAVSFVLVARNTALDDAFCKHASIFIVV